MLVVASVAGVPVDCAGADVEEVSAVLKEDALPVVKLLGVDWLDASVG
jgi:hypothetical protein